MSRIGKKSVKIPEGVQVTLEPSMIKVSGPKGELTKQIPQGVKVEVRAGEINLHSREGSENLWGLTRTLIYNMIEGVTSGFKKELEIVGVGYRALKEGDKLVLHLGFSHPVVIPQPEGIDFEVAKNRITVLGIDKEKVGQVAAQIRSFRKPEPYKGKGIRYIGEKVKRKAGKAAKAVGSLGAGQGG